MNTILVAIMIINFYLYIGIIVWKYGVLQSISESYYKTGKKIWFTLFCWLLALPAMIVGSSVLMFIAGSAIAFTGAASAFKERYIHPIHFVGAVIGIVFGLASLIVDFHDYVIGTSAACIITIIMLLGNKISNPIWWIEIVAITSIMITLIKSLLIS